jgi:deoxyribose-phosphate aldolase
METLADLLALAEKYDQELPPPPEPLIPQGAAIAAWIDHTLLKPEATEAQIVQLCQEALQFSFAAVCVNPVYVHLAARLLQNSPVAVCTVVGFPLGATLTSCKVLETLACLHAGASEIDMVLPIGALKGAAYGQVLNDISAVVQAAHNQSAIVKVILETALLTRQEKITACLLAQQAGADFVKTSTGFAAAGATVEDVALMRRVVGDQLGVKAAGGVRTIQDALAMIRAGASRIGTSSGVKILESAHELPVSL